MNLNTFLFLNLGAGEILIMLVFLVLPLAIWLWAIVDVLKSKFENSTEKLIWLVAIVFLPVIGAILYLIIGRRQKIEPYAVL